MGIRNIVRMSVAVLAAAPTLAGAVQLVSPEDNAEFCALQPLHREFLSLDRDGRRARFLDRDWRHRIVQEGVRSEPLPLKLVWKDAEGACEVRVERNGQTVFSTNVVGASEIDVWNLEIAREYVWSVRDAKGIARRRFRTRDQAPRLIRLGTIPNVRDLGGRIGLDGRRVRQGLIYRSAGLNDNANAWLNAQETMALYDAGQLESKYGEAGRKVKEQIERDRGEFRFDPKAPFMWKSIPRPDPSRGADRLDAASKEYARKVLGWKSDVDLRWDLECWGMTGSPLGEDVTWHHVSSVAYAKLATEQGKSAFAKVFRIFLERGNYPIDFHCIGGADRAGSVAFILNALLGVSDEELDKDWEMTCFTYERQDFGHAARYDRLRALFDAYPGNTTREKVEGYVRELGFTEEDLRTFREIMLEPQACPYGVCAHVTRGEGDAYRLGRTLTAMDLAGIGCVRSDFDNWAMRKTTGEWDFSRYDGLLSELESRGVVLLPILYGPSRPPLDRGAYGDYIRTIVRHFGRRLPVVEIWNEANAAVDHFSVPDPVVYAETLKTAYAAVKDVDPSIRVAYTGTAGVPIDWIRKTFEAGAAKAFDVMNVHPYSHPAPPEGSMDVRTEALRKLMAEFGVADRPIWFTEVGWPTHTPAIPRADVLLAGLKVARPDKTRWRMVLADNAVDGPAPDQAEAKRLEDLLPEGSEVVCCTQRETVRRLAEGETDAVVYPFDESFPVETVAAVNAFVRDGGVLVDFGGMPCYSAKRDGVTVSGASISDFPFGYRAWWMDRPGTYPKSALLSATEKGIAAGLAQPSEGFAAERFLSPDRIGGESEWIPLVAGRGTNGVELTAAAVVRYFGERKGAAVLCSLFPRYGEAVGAVTEERQAHYTARALALAFAEGVEAFFCYNLRALEDDPYHSERHFGLMHADFTPKPAYSAYAAFTRERPPGSVNSPDTWHDPKRCSFFPKWKRPDGAVCGMIWTLEPTRPRVLRFVGNPTFRDVYGRKLGVRVVGEGDYRLAIGESPVYYSGGAFERFVR